MKKTFYYLLLLFISLVIQSCKENNIEPPLIYPPDDFFPNVIGSWYSYSTQISDSSGLILTGSRSQYFNNQVILEGTTYQSETDTFTLDRSSEISQSYFRKSESGVFYYTDTAGIWFTVPDSLKQYLNFDREYRLLFIPLSINQNWPVYRVEFNYNGFRFYIINSYADIISKDTLNLNLNSLNLKVVSYKIKFTLKMQLSPSSQPIIYEADGWTVNNIGFVKWEGDSEIFNFIFRTNIFPSESTVKMDITNYNIPASLNSN